MLYILVENCGKLRTKRCERQSAAEKLGEIRVVKGCNELLVLYTKMSQADNLMQRTTSGEREA